MPGAEHPHGPSTEHSLRQGVPRLGNDGSLVLAQAADMASRNSKDVVSAVA
jgi:hypothetical protein